MWGGEGRSPPSRLTSSSRPRWVSAGLRTAHQCRSDTSTAPPRLSRRAHGQHAGEEGRGTRLGAAKASTLLSRAQVTVAPSTSYMTHSPCDLAPVMVMGLRSLSCRMAPPTEGALETEGPYCCRGAHA